MKLRYKIIIIVLVLFTTIGLFLYYYIPRLIYEYNEKYDCYLVSYAFGDLEEYVIPKVYNNKPVYGTTTRAFYQHKKLKSIKFEEPSNFKYVGRLSFSECDNLEYINLEYIEIIERGAFSYDYKLNNLCINAEIIGGSSFYKCEGLVNVELNNTLSIGSMAFSNTSIKNILIPKCCIEIGVDCFYDCNYIKEVNIYNETLEKNIYLLDYDYIKIIN